MVALGAAAGRDAGGGELDGSASALPSAQDNPNTRDLAWRAATPYRLRIERGDGPGTWRGLVTGPAGDTIEVEVMEGRHPREPMLVAAVVDEPIGFAAYIARSAANRLMRELVRDAYESPLIPTSADGSSCALNNPPSNPDARALNGCIPFSKRQPGSRPVPEPDSGDGARSAE